MLVESDGLDDARLVFGQNRELVAPLVECGRVEQPHGQRRNQDDDTGHDSQENQESVSETHPEFP